VDLRRYIGEGDRSNSGMNASNANCRSIRWRNIAACIVGGFACTAMLGDALRIPAVKGVASATAIAPCPKVFCDTKGMEAFASEFFLRFEVEGHEREMKLTPQLYSKLKGPYNRRNVYGAALSFAPRLPEPLWRTVFNYALSSEGPMRRELGIPSDATNIVVVIRTKTCGRNDEWELRQ